MSPPHVLPLSRSRRSNAARAIGSGGQLSDFSLSSIGWRRGPGRGGAPVDAPLSLPAPQPSRQAGGSFPTRSSWGESESLRLLDRQNQSHAVKALALIFFIAMLLVSAPANVSVAAEQDPRMVAPPNAVRGR